MTAEGVTYFKAPNMQAGDVTLIALGKKVATTFEYFDGTTGKQESSFSPGACIPESSLPMPKSTRTFTGCSTERRCSRQLRLRRWQRSATRILKSGDDAGRRHTHHSLHLTKTFLLLRRDSVYAPSDPSGIEIPVTETYSDYRNVEGVMLPLQVCGKFRHARQCRTTHKESSLTSIQFALRPKTKK